MPLAEIVKLVNIGTLFAFVVVNIGVIILRRTRPDLERGYRVPFVPVFPIIGTLLCIYLMVDLPLETWGRFLIWMALGLVIYFVYGRTPLAAAAGRGHEPGGGAVEARTTSSGCAPAERRHRLAGDRGQQRRGGRLAELRVVDPHAGQRRRGERGQRRVVEAGDRQVAGHVDPALARGAQRGRGEHVAGVHDRRHVPSSRRLPEGDRPGLEPGGGERLAPHLAGAPARARSRSLEPQKPIRRCPSADEVLDHRLHPPRVLGLQPRERARRDGMAGHHGRQLDPLEARVVELDVAEQEAVDAAGAASRS